MSEIAAMLRPASWIHAFRNRFTVAGIQGPSQAAVGPVRDIIDAPIPVNAHGSPVSLKPGCWYVCFVPGLNRQWWHPFVHPIHKHVFVIRPDGDHRWLLIESWWNRIMATTLSAEQAESFLRWAARGSILLVREHIPGRSSQVRGWMTCAALVAHHLKRRYWVWTPHQLYRALRRETDTREVSIPRLAAEFSRRHDMNAALRHSGARCHA